MFTSALCDGVLYVAYTTELPVRGPDDRGTTGVATDSGIRFLHLLLLLFPLVLHPLVSLDLPSEFPPLFSLLCINSPVSAPNSCDILKLVAPPQLWFACFSVSTFSWSSTKVSVQFLNFLFKYLFSKTCEGGHLCKLVTFYGTGKFVVYCTSSITSVLSACLSWFMASEERLCSMVLVD